MASTAHLQAALATLPTMELEHLRAEWLRLHRCAAPPRHSRDLLARGIAYKLQTAAVGGLPSATRRKLLALAANPISASRRSASQARPGDTLVRSWGGRTHRVHVLPDGFEHDGVRHRSLSGVAQAITGVHWSGPRFFGLVGKTDAQAS